MFSMAKFFALALAATTVVTAATTPQQVVDGFRLLIQKAKALEPVAKSITIVNAPLIVILSGFTDQIKNGNTLIELLKDGPTGLTQADENLIFDAYKEFASAEKSTQTILIGKADVVRNVQIVGPPVAAVLRQLEGVIDSISSTLTQKIVSQAQDFESEANSLGSVLDLSITKYDGLSQ
ncbi:hypothetical protein VE02_09398 [Pseudogymnoascus sp. 03VT05]|nr:hypothetical protein VE02_09398 [Pseudogymnoascus sp. 03VT05]